MKLLRLFLCLLLILTLTACGSDPVASTTDGGKGPSPNASVSGDGSTPDPSDPADPSEPAGPAPADTWFNAEGQYGTVEYTFNQYGMPEKTIFYHHSGKIWRTIEHYVMEDNAYSSLLYCQSIYNANGTLLFSLQETRQTKDSADYEIPDMVSVYDHIAKTSACHITYEPYGNIMSLTRDNTYDGAQDYAIITWKNAAQMEKITLYYREGSRKATMFMHYEDDQLAYIGYGEDYEDDPMHFYKVEYTDGRISSLTYGSASIDSFSGKVQYFTKDTNDIHILLNYDAAGHITGIDMTDHSFRYIWNFTFEGDTLTATEYLKGRPSYDLVDFTRGYFTFNPDGTFSTADYSYLDDDHPSYYVFTYHANGMIANVKGYRESAYHLEEGDELDLEWEYSFAEDGSVISD